MTVLVGLCALRGTKRDPWKEGDAHTENEVRKALSEYAATLIKNGGEAPG